MQLTLVDAFAARPFTGNQAAVAVLDHFPEDAAMQQVAGELNWSETAFCVPRPDGDWDLRWFTPVVEVDLCGHATLATAHVLGGTARFHTRSGVLDCRPVAAPDGDWIAMAFPADPPSPGPVPDGLADGLGVGTVTWFGHGRFDALAVVGDAGAVRAMRPDMAAVAALGTRCLIVSAPGDRPGIDCVSRVFGPNAGVAEDPVTGSAHCTLAEYWGERLGRTELVGEQASARGGTVAMERRGEQVVIAGRAVIVGRILLLESLTGERIASR